MKERVKRELSKEALLGLGLFFGYFLWWYLFGYGLGGQDPSLYGYVLGLPSWFFWSCVAGFVVFSLAAWLAVRFLFQDVPLDEGR